MAVNRKSAKELKAIRNAWDLPGLADGKAKEDIGRYTTIANTEQSYTGALNLILDYYIANLSQALATRFSLNDSGTRF